MPTSGEVLVIDDDPGVQHFVGLILKRQGYPVVQAHDGEQALRLAAESHPRAVILDLALPSIGGLEVCRRLRNWYTRPILVLSASEDERTIVHALDLGADDYLTKPFRPAELLARMRALLRRSSPANQDSTEISAGPIAIDLAKRSVEAAGNSIRLTRTEFEILALLVRNADCVMTSEAILREVWGPHHGEYGQSLRVHIGHVRKKLEQAGLSPRCIATQAGVGYRFTTDNAPASAAAAHRS